MTSLRARAAARSVGLLSSAIAELDSGAIHPSAALSMQAPVVLVHSSPLQPLWQQPGPTQVGPAIQAALRHGELSVERILGAIEGIDPRRAAVTFTTAAAPRRGAAHL